MNKILPLNMARPLALAAAMAFGSSAIFASPAGFDVSRNEEALVKVGMTQDEVLQTLGRPAQTLRFPRMDSTTWTYNLPGEPDTVFDIDFDQAGRVASIEERYIELE